MSQAQSVPADTAASKAAPQGQDSSLRPATKQGTLALEGATEPLTLQLFEYSGPPPSLKFSTYLPEDILAEPAQDGGKNVVRFTANFAGHRQDQAFIEVLFYPEGTAEAEARALTKSAAASLVKNKPPSGTGSQFTWSLIEYVVNYQAKGHGFTGVVELGKHGDRFFRMTLHYPEEFADGFAPRAHLILGEWRWENPREGL